MSSRLEREAAMDDTSDWAVKHQQARFSPIGSAIPDPRPPVRFVPTSILSRAERIRLSINDTDIASAVDWMHAHDELSEAVTDRIDELAKGFAEKRMEEVARNA